MPTVGAYRVIISIQLLLFSFLGVTEGQSFFSDNFWLGSTTELFVTEDRIVFCTVYPKYSQYTYPKPRYYLLSSDGIKICSAFEPNDYICNRVGFFNDTSWWASVYSPNTTWRLERLHLFSGSDNCKRIDSYYSDKFTNNYFHVRDSLFLDLYNSRLIQFPGSEITNIVFSPPFPNDIAYSYYDSTTQLIYLFSNSINWEFKVSSYTVEGIKIEDKKVFLPVLSNSGHRLNMVVREKDDSWLIKFDSFDLPIYRVSSITGQAIPTPFKNFNLFKKLPNGDYVRAEMGSSFSQLLLHKYDLDFNQLWTKSKFIDTSTLIDFAHMVEIAPNGDILVGMELNCLHAGALPNTGPLVGKSALLRTDQEASDFTVVSTSIPPAFSSLSLFPNPVKYGERVNLTLNNQEKLKVKILMSTGKILWEGIVDSGGELPFDKWDKGIYFVYVAAGDQYMIGKVVSLK